MLSYLCSAHDTRMPLAAAQPDPLNRQRMHRADWLCSAKSPRLSVPFAATR